MEWKSCLDDAPIEERKYLCAERFLFTKPGEDEFFYYVCTWNKEYGWYDDEYDPEPTFYAEFMYPVIH